MFRRLFLVPLVALTVSTCAPAPAPPLPPQVQGEIATKQLLLLMDRDQNGKVSRAEFMAFMDAQFNQLDVNHDGELDVNELMSLHYGASHPGGSVGGR
jgi:hypothetical protein